VHSAKFAAQGDGMAMSSWWVYHWDHHARYIFDAETGPFRACDRHAHRGRRRDAELTITPELPPDDWEL
jgi:hypothetical protein